MIETGDTRSLWLYLQKQKTNRFTKAIKTTIQWLLNNTITTVGYMYKTKVHPSTPSSEDQQWRSTITRYQPVTGVRCYNWKDAAARIHLCAPTVTATGSDNVSSDKIASGFFSFRPASNSEAAKTVALKCQVCSFHTCSWNICRCRNIRQILSEQSWLCRCRNERQFCDCKVWLSFLLPALAAANDTITYLLRKDPVRQVHVAVCMKRACFGW